MVNFNAVKTHCCLISRRVGRNLTDISFDSNSLEFSDKISMLGVTLGSALSWNDHITTTAKAAACKLGLLFRSRRYFTPSSLLTLYKAQIRPCLEYASHLWRGPSKHSLATLDAIQKRAIKLIGDPALTNSLDSLAHRRTISALSLYYRYYHGVCSVERNQLPPLKPPLLETRGFRTLSTPSLSNWIKIERALSPTLLFLRPPETGTHSLPPSSPRRIIFSIHRHLQLLPSP